MGTGYRVGYCMLLNDTNSFIVFKDSFRGHASLMRNKEKASITFVLYYSLNI